MSSFGQTLKILKAQHVYVEGADISLTSPLHLPSRLEKPGNTQAHHSAICFHIHPRYLTWRPYRLGISIKLTEGQPIKLTEGQGEAPWGARASPPQGSDFAVGGHEDDDNSGAHESRQSGMSMQGITVYPDQHPAAVTTSLWSQSCVFAAQFHTGHELDEWYFLQSTLLCPNEGCQEK